MAITPNTVNVDGKPITVALTMTSSGVAAEESINLETYMPLIDIRLPHPVLSMFFLSTQTDSTSSQTLGVGDELARGTAATAGNEWRIVDANTVAFWRGADEDGILFVSYIPFGSQQA